jgi:ferrochelatase
MSTAVILVNMGGPVSIDDIECYLRNLFSDPDLFQFNLPEKIKESIINWMIKKRIAKTSSIYQQIGGSSPLNEITRKQAAALEQLLNSDNKKKFRVYYALRYYQPYLTGIWDELLKKTYRQVIIFPLYPQFSYTTTGSFINLWKKLDHYQVHTKIIRSYYDHPEYIKANVDLILLSLADHLKNEDKIELIMTAHGLPVRNIKRGDPYAREIDSSVREIKRYLPVNVNITLGYQSKIGPLRWLKPDTADILKKMAAGKIKKVFIYPLSFVADNSETLYEIDIFYRNLAKKMGIDEFNFIRPFNQYPGFIAAIKNIILELIERELDKKYIYDPDSSC